MVDASVIPKALIQVRALTVLAGRRPVLRDVRLDIAAGEAVAILGPSGAGKSTLLKCLNRLIDLTPGLTVQGEICYRGKSIRDPEVDVDALRARIGMLFQQPIVFPISIRKNVLFGVRHLKQVPKSEWEALMEGSLRDAFLWDEVKDRLDESGFTLSIGQQQRLCLARTLAVGPEVILLDEPTSALDAVSTGAVEESLLRLRGHRTLILVTHHQAQAERMANTLVFMEPGDQGGAISCSLSRSSGISFFGVSNQWNGNSIE